MQRILRAINPLIISILTSLSSLRIGFPFMTELSPCSFRTHQNTDLAATETYHENGYSILQEILWPPVSLSIKLP